MCDTEAIMLRGKRPHYYMVIIRLIKSTFHEPHPVLFPQVRLVLGSSEDSRAGGAAAGCGCHVFRGCPSRHCPGQHDRRHDGVMRSGADAGNSAPGAHLVSGCGYILKGMNALILSRSARLLNTLVHARGIWHIRFYRRMYISL